MWKYALIHNQICLPETTLSTQPHTHCTPVGCSHYRFLPSTHLSVCSVLISLKIRFYSRHVYTILSIRGNALRILPSKLNLYLIYRSLFFLTLVLFPCFAPGSSICVNKTGLFIWSTKLKAAKKSTTGHVHVHTSLYTWVRSQVCVWGGVCVCVCVCVCVHARNDLADISPNLCEWGIQKCAHVSTIPNPLYHLSPIFFQKIKLKHCKQFLLE